ncbi:sugar phosphate isomerase/epimerase [Thermostilla marina]
MQHDRRTFLATGSALLAAGFTAASQLAEGSQDTPQTRDSRRFRMALHCGAIGVSADLRQSIEWAVKYGFEAVEPRADALSKLDDAELASLLDGLKAKNLTWSVTGLPVQFRGDEADFVADLKRLPQFAKVLNKAGADRLGTWIVPGSNELTFRRNFSRHAKRLAAVARILDDYDLRLGLEYVGPKTSWTRYRYPFIHTMDEMKELIACIDLPNVGITLDSWHWYTAQETIDDLRSLPGDRIISVHLNDAPAGLAVDEQLDTSRELPCATGVIDLKTFLSGLVEIGYDGPVYCEPFKKELRTLPPEKAVETVAEAMHRAFALIESPSQ